MDGLSYMSDTSAGNTSPSDNIDEGKLTKRSFFARAEALGTAEGKGDNSRPGLFVLTTEAARLGAIDDKKGADGKTDVADEIFDRYSKKVAMAQGVGWKPQASVKQQTSKLRVAVKLGLLPQVNGLDLCNRVVKAQAAQRAAREGKNDFSPYDGLVKVARFQLQDPDKPLSDDVIAGLLIKSASDVPEEADRLEKVMKACQSLAEAKEDQLTEESVDALTEAASVIMTRIRELGGSTSMRKQAAKAEKAAAQAVALVDRARLHAEKAREALSPAE